MFLQGANAFWGGPNDVKLSGRSGQVRSGRQVRQAGRPGTDNGQSGHSCGGRHGEDTAVTR